MTAQSLDLDAIRQRADAATPGPWHAVDLRHQRGGQIRIFPKRGGFLIANVFRTGDHPAADADLIAHAREDIPALLGALNAVLRLHGADSYGNCCECGGEATR